MTDHDDTIVETYTGLVFRVRPAHRDDEAALAEFFKHVTPEDLRFRFLGGIWEVSHDRLVEILGSITAVPRAFWPSRRRGADHRGSDARLRGRA